MALTNVEIAQLRAKYFSANLSLSYAKQEPLCILQGKGQYLYDEKGHEYLDCVNNVAHVGHCHPKVVQAATEQLGILNTNTRYLHPNMVQYAQKLLEKFQPPLEISSDLHKKARRCRPRKCLSWELQHDGGNITVQVPKQRWISTEGACDIVTMGKPIGNGFPMAAVVTTREIADAFANGMEYFNTFGGCTTACAVGKAVLDVIENEKLQQNALNVGEFTLTRLKELKTKHALIGDVRGIGLFLGVELVRDHNSLEPATEEAEAIALAMKVKGVLVSTDGPYHNVIKMKPPICFTKKDGERLVQALDEALLHISITI